MKNIISTKQGMWKFYHDKNLGICFYGPKDDTPMILFEKGAPDFDAVCDNEGCIYLLCQDDKNNIYLYYYDKISWRKQCILEARSAVPYDKNFTLLVTNGLVNAFYTIRHAKRTLLIHHILDGEKEPTVIETSPSPITYTVSSDGSNNIYCIYQKESIGFQMFNWGIKEWQNFSTLAVLPGELRFISAICDLSDRLHITCSLRERSDYKVYYISKNGVQEISDGFTRNPEPVILCTDQFYILLKTNGRLLQCTAKEPEQGFLKPTYYFPGSFCTHSLFKLSCSADLRLNKIFTGTVYGTEPRLNYFEAAIIQENLDRIDFSPVSVPTLKIPDIETFVENAEPFNSTDS